jgi:hypothetical protein
MVTIAIDRLLYSIRDKDFNKLKQLENNPLYDNQYDNKESTEFLEEITLNYKASNVVEGYYFLGVD